MEYVVTVGAMLLLAACVYTAAIWGFPYGVMAVAYGRVARNARGAALYHAPRVTAADRQIKFASPDILYSIGNYSLRRGAIMVQLPPTDIYIALSLYANNTDNYFTINDSQMDQGQTTLVIFRGAPPAEAPQGARMVRTPTTRGVLLARFFADQPEHVGRIEQLRRQIQLVRLESGDKDT